jgi:hypothetical protein
MVQAAPRKGGSVGGGGEKVKGVNGTVDREL